MEKHCEHCKFYGPIKGEPAAGYCLFADFPVLPFWMDTVDNITAIRRLPGNDIMGVDGENCDAFQSQKG